MKVDVSGINLDNIPMTEEEVKAYIKENADTVQEARKLWMDIETSVISILEDQIPSHPSRVVEKSLDQGYDINTKSIDGLEKDDVEFTHEFMMFHDNKSIDNYQPLVEGEKEYDNERVIFAPAMVSDVPDREDDLATADAIEKSAHTFMRKGKVDDVDLNHETTRGADDSDTHRANVVESWILRKDQEFETPSGDTVEYKKGDWFVGLELVDDKTWEAYKSGDITGLSVMARYYPVKVEKESEDGEDTLILSEYQNKSMSKSQESEEAEQDTKTDDVNLEDVSIDEFAEKQDLTVNDIVGLLADAMGVQTSEVVDALDPLMDGGSDEEETEEESQDDEKEVSEESAAETDEKLQDMISNLSDRMDTIESKLDDVSDAEQEEKESDEGEEEVSEDDEKNSEEGEETTEVDEKGSEMGHGDDGYEKDELFEGIMDY